jgi:hypothetical protein
VRERKTRRKPLSYWLRVFDRNRDVALGNLADITKDGFSIMSSEKRPEGETLDIRMKLPSEMDGPSDLLVTGRVRWCRTGAPEGYHKIGFEFVDVDPETQTVIQRLISEFAYEETPGVDSPFYPQELPEEDK